MYTKGERCSASIYDSSGWHTHQCNKKAVTERDGMPYCKIHDPEYIEEKRTEKQKKFEEKYATMISRSALQDARHVATAGLTLEELQRLNPNLCRAAPMLYEALKEIVLDLMGNASTPEEATKVRMVSKAIAKVEGKE